jgi:hypothetical protein
MTVSIIVGLFAGSKANGIPRDNTVLQITCYCLTIKRLQQSDTAEPVKGITENPSKMEGSISKMENQARYSNFGSNSR